MTGNPDLRAAPANPAKPPIPQPAAGILRRRLRGLCEAAVAAGAPPAWFGHRWVRHETLTEYFARQPARRAVDAGRHEVVHPPRIAHNPLPRNIADRASLPADAGWWGYSFHDVPERPTGETGIATLPDCRLAFYTDGPKNNFYPAILNRDQRALRLRETVFRPGHGRALRSVGKPLRLRKATWILERVYHNHSHWLTAHLPKLCLLRARGALDDLVLPQRRDPVIDASLRMLGLTPTDFPSFDPDRPLEVQELTLLETDRFRPELLQPVRAALTRRTAGQPGRRVFISRAASRGRRLLNEDALWPVLRDAGFERVLMETLGFEEQVRLMEETAILLAPHGAGLTNMMFCPAGAHIIEMADLGFPNPNFYALACAMEHQYWLVPAKAVGDAHPLDQDLHVSVAAVGEVLAQVERWKPPTAQVKP